MKTELSSDELDIIEAFREKRPIICNVNFGFGVVLREAEDGRGVIEVDQDISPAPSHRALKEWMKSTAERWLLNAHDRGAVH